MACWLTGERAASARLPQEQVENLTPFRENAQASARL